MALTKTQVSELYVAIFNRASEGTGNTYWQGEGSAAEVAQKMLDTVDAKEYFGTAIDDDKAFIEHIYINTLGKTYADDAEGIDFWVARLANGESRGEVVAALVVAATDPKYAGTAAQEQFLNRVEVSNYAADTVKDAPANYKQSLGFDGDLTVTDDAATVGAAKGNVDKLAGDKPGVNGKTIELTHKADNLVGTDGDDVFYAAVKQNETGSGALANTFETGDVLIGGEGNDVLRADLIDTGTIQDSFASAPISATTSGIEEVYLRAQMPNQQNTVDAEKMADVQQWWTDNSRSDIIIEDIRSATEDTTFGMRETDPGVSFTNYFNALYLEGQVDDGASSFSFVIAETGDAAAELANINVFAINFEHNGVNYSLDSDAVRAADTWTELQTALQAGIDAEAALEGLTVTHNGGGNFVVTDPAAGTFDIDPSGTVVTSSTTLETKDAVLGRLDPEEGPTVTNVVLDGAGNGSQGGALTIGAMSGLRGVEVFEVNVDRDSHLTSMTSANQTASPVLVENRFLEVVNLNSIGAEGDLQVGARTVSLDGRAATTGLVNVREVNGENFAGSLNLGISLDNNTLGRYLDPSDEVVNFTYTGGAQDDLFNVSATQAVSSDADFAMQIDLGAGDDRLILNVPVVRAVSVDGGEGENSIVVTQSHGTTAANTFEAFANFQTYEVEGNGNTVHDFTSMSGIENVVIATGAAAPNTQLIDLEAAQNVTVSGKNQTIGNNSTNNQLFNIVTLTNDAGVDRTVTLDNTARLSNAADGVATPKDGILSVANLVIDQQTIGGVAGTSATRNLTIESAGARNVANVIAQLDAARVNTLTLEGTQDLTINVNSIANTPATAQAPLSITGADLTGDLNLALNGTQLNLITGTGTDTIVGTAGDSDTFMVYGALTAGNNASVTGFETVQIGSAAGTLFGDTVINQASSGTLNTASIVADQYVVANLNGTLQLNGLGSGKTIDLGDANTDVNGVTTTVDNQTLNQQINIVSSAANAAGTLAEVSINRLDVIGSGTATNIDIGDSIATVGAGIGGFRTINLDVARDASLAAAAADNNTVNLAVGSQARTLNITGGQDDRTNGVGADTLNMNGQQLLNSLETIDISGYNGQVSLTMEQGALATQTDVNFVMSGYDANIILSNVGGTIASVTHNSVFEFTAAGTTANPTVWTIDNIIGADEVGANVNNQTLFDVSGLNISNYAQLDIADTGFALDGTALGGGTVAIRSEAQNNDGVETWEIVVIGLSGTTAAADITADNFIFA